MSTTQEDTSSWAGMYLTVRVDTFTLGIETSAIHEIVPASLVRYVSRRNRTASGIVDFRGIWFPVMDVCEGLGFADGRFGTGQVIVVVRAGEEGSEDLLGLIVDETGDVISVGSGNAALRETPEQLKGVSWIRGVVRVGSRDVGLVDPQKAAQSIKPGAKTE